MNKIRHMPDEQNDAHALCVSGPFSVAKSSILKNVATKKKKKKRNLN
jgi:GTP1/Obg family GTP-binding protein